MADLQEKLDALKGLVGVLNNMDEGETHNNNATSSPNNSHSPAPMPGRNRSVGKYNNSGTQKIKGIASGISTLAIGSGDARRRPAQAQSTPNTNTNTNTNSNTSSSTPSSEGFTYLNSAKQDIKGLTNQTGYVKGNANGVINFGTLTASASVQRQ
ncbi:hypothetical protein GLYMA_07G240800v4 [Glycine max]|uniref:Uncharacterized protein n=2 Tax=Glycine subgen. Soja TaxID=1462606 RepID=K7L3K4_SOYBN|nr:hypothetical protein GYH30_019421 [Glycine max]KRH50746.1 hypothetical protein GLYMA_07G240800v4 [Glycine max]RZC04421.1 hypothetical protein D0Y65_018835 [Glycine soja]